MRLDCFHLRYEPIPTAKGSLCYYKVFLKLIVMLILRFFETICEILALQAKEGEDKWREAQNFKLVAFVF